MSKLTDNLAMAQVYATLAAGHYASAAIPNGWREDSMKRAREYELKTFPYLRIAEKILEEENNAEG